MLFAGIDHDFAIVLEQINAEWPGIALIGCTTDGEMSSHILFAEDSLALVLLSGDDFHAVTGVARLSRPMWRGRFAPVRTMRWRLPAAVWRGKGGVPPLHHLARRPDRERSAAPALRAELGDAVPIFGGTAGDQYDSRTKQFHARKCSRIPCRLLFGRGRLLLRSDTGWRPIGREGRITTLMGTWCTRSTATATAFYREFLGNADITHLTEYPLAVTADDGRGANSYYLRAPGRTDEAGGCIHFLGDVPDGARVHITTTNRDQILAATRSSFQHALDDFPKDSGGVGKPALALCISCAGRKQILGSRTQEEVRIVKELLGDVPAAGFYGYGEIARLEEDGISHYHNETFTALLLGGRVGSA
jgi:hypothetical protein